MGFNAAEAALGPNGDPDLQWQIYFGRALAQEARGDKTAAIASLVAAVKLIESVRNRLQEQRFRAGYVEDKYEVYIELVRLQLEQGRTADAFSTAERLRARSFSEQTGGVVIDHRSATTDRRTEAQLRERIRQLQRAIANEEDQGGSGETAESSRQVLAGTRSRRAGVPGVPGRSHGRVAPRGNARGAARRFERSRPGSRMTRPCWNTWSARDSLMVFVVTRRARIGEDDRRSGEPT